ncbi:transporter substrate-binding domain-containing protein [Colwellia sp. 1_MG-2023]|uniref:substrate-binding periplasmic protein n=1 Tax=Colwellia sp. 1_MG-2023 TaxID=3062649 RepID=UPI0026E3AF7F|nr:transporter substrate-binding domain-containing protein [Colwellia sp. 1_MG-2023]MDO6444225.1 transporter substrate-binding domain-containing protein [Colwellia sp. 1_MG-2023]
MRVFRFASFFLFILIGFTTGIARSAQSPKIDIIWATDTWEGFTNRDGTGIYHEIFSKIFEHSPYHVSIQYLPWKRALHQVVINKAQVSGALPKSNKYLFADLPILTQPLSILTQADQSLSLAQIQTLVGVWPLTYAEELMQSDISQYLDGITAQYRADAIALLQKNKVDYYLDIRSILELHLANLPLEEQSKYHIQDLSTLNLYLIFSDDEQGRVLKKYYDETTQQLLENNTLQPIYKKYNLSLKLDEKISHSH